MSLQPSGHRQHRCRDPRPRRSRWARHRGVTLPITTDTVDTAAQELDLAVAVADVYRTDPSFGAPPAVWHSLAAALPTLLSHD